jgi:hypothetical protein
MSHFVFWICLLASLANSRPLGSETRIWGWVVILAFLDYLRLRK